MSATHAAVTIVSKNYFALAATLAQTYRRHHPDNDFIIVLVDKADGDVPASLPCGAEVIELARFAIPDIGRFIYRYSIMELNTAVKPFVMADLFERRGYETLLYLDPDIWIHRPLAKVYEALGRASIALTPHMRRPFHDSHLPSDTTILQSGTYNLGFIGLKRGPSARALLDWWMTKLYRDCVVDIASGLFVDQKWIDLVPGFFPDHAIVSDPTCNVAYWNLHERRIEREGEGWTVDGEPLTFFHFSGYSPYAPNTLSKHQDRHSLSALPALKALTDAYANALEENGHARTSKLAYAFATLPNGVRLPLTLVRDAMQWASRAGVETPCPVSEPDAFCRFLMSRGVIPDRPKLVLLFHFLMRQRGDVAGAFPAALTDSDDPSFRNWLKTSGVTEYEIRDLLPFERPAAIGDYVADLFERLRKAERVDILDKHADMWSDARAFEAFATWVATHGVRQLRLERAHAEQLRRALPGIAKVLNLYFLRGDLQSRFPVLGDPNTVNELVRWLREHRNALDLEAGEVSLFAEFARASRDRLEAMRFLYGHRGRPSAVTPSVYDIDARQREIGGVVAGGRIAGFLAGKDFDPADHFIATFGMHGANGDDDDPERTAVPGLEAGRQEAFARRLREGLAARAERRLRVNVAGYLNAPSGMGESARSLALTLAQTQAAVREVTLPHPLASPDAVWDVPRMFGWPMSGADLSITVANADAASSVEAFLPRNFHAAHNVGYWVWETEELPPKFRAADKPFDEIWTPSRYSAEAIARTIRKPVRVLRHTLDFASIDAARADRPRYGLPDGATLFGFAFDPLSVLERKNVHGLIRAFLSAFRDDDRCYLALKVSGRPHANYDYEMLRAAGASKRILFLEGTLARADAMGFMKSLDAYVSLHRAEGFGLTCAEAMALGLPVVASDYSGNLEFMDKDNSLLVPTRVIETARPYGAYPAGTRWGDPDLDAAATAMRSLLERERRAALGAKAAASVRKRLDPKAVAADAMALVERLVKDEGGKRVA